MNICLQQHLKCFFFRCLVKTQHLTVVNKSPNYPLYDILKFFLNIWNYNTVKKISQHLYQLSNHDTKTYSVRFAMYIFLLACSIVLKLNYCLNKKSIKLLSFIVLSVWLDEVWVLKTTLKTLLLNLARSKFSSKHI